LRRHLRSGRFAKKEVEGGFRGGQRQGWLKKQDGGRGRFHRNSGDKRRFSSSPPAFGRGALRVARQGGSAADHGKSGQQLGEFLVFFVSPPAMAQEARIGSKGTARENRSVQDRPHPTPPPPPHHPPPTPPPGVGWGGGGGPGGGGGGGGWLGELNALAQVASLVRTVHTSIAQELRFVDAHNFRARLHLFDLISEALVTLSEGMPSVVRNRFRWGGGGGGGGRSRREFVGMAA